MENKTVLDYQPFELKQSEKELLFMENLLEELVHHYENNTMYKKFCIKNNFNPKDFKGCIEDIPFIPVHVFKALGHKLSSVDENNLKTKLQSSATSGIPSTILLDKVTSRRQTKAMARVMKEILGPSRKHFCIMDIDPLSPNAVNLGARAAAVKGYLNFASSSDYFVDVSEKNSKLEFLEEKFIEHLSNLNKDEPIVIFGFTFVLYHSVFKNLLEKNIKFSLPNGSKVIHIGGWKKLESNKVDKEIFNKEISDVLGISPDDVVDIYGFTEQMGLNYPDCRCGWKRVHAYSDIIVRNEDNLKPSKDGEVGLLQFLSPVQHSYPGNVVLTDDLGICKNGKCECGFEGRFFKVVGRAKKAEIRGCGEIMSEKVISKNRNETQEEENIIIYHSPIKLTGSQKASEKLVSIITALKSKEDWLKNQPVESILGLIDKARDRWKTDRELAKYQDIGLNFLYEWCDPNRLRVLLNGSLKGNIGHIDSFLPREDIPHSSLRALPRGNVSHWLAGNVPLLGMFALIQSILTKNTNILKVSANESQALPLLLNSFKDLEYTSPGGHSINGNDILETLAVVYFDRHQIKLAKTFSEYADVRIAWGGREAIESVASLHKKYNCQDILFGP